MNKKSNSRDAVCKRYVKRHPDYPKRNCKMRIFAKIRHVSRIPPRTSEPTKGRERCDEFTAGMASFSGLWRAASTGFFCTHVGYGQVSLLYPDRLTADNYGFGISVSNRNDSPYDKRRDDPAGGTMLSIYHDYTTGAFFSGSPLSKDRAYHVNIHNSTDGSLTVWEDQ